MKTFTIDDAGNLAESLAQHADERPDWLRNLRHACDSDASYYRFFYEMVKRSNGPLRIVEVGTDRGVSAAHFAAANARAEVVTIDISLAAVENARRLNLPNLRAVHADSAVAAKMLACELLDGKPQFDVAFIDGLHTFNNAYGEYVLYRNLLRDGGLMFFDDIRLDMANREMEIFWEHVIDQKRELPALHGTGFGVCKVDRTRNVPSWSEVIEKASASMKAAENK